MRRMANRTAHFVVTLFVISAEELAKQNASKGQVAPKTRAVIQRPPGEDADEAAAYNIPIPCDPESLLSPLVRRIGGKQGWIGIMVWEREHVLLTSGTEL